MFFEAIFIAITTHKAIFNHLVNSQQLNFRFKNYVIKLNQFLNL
jgi:hypothetical protein